MLQLELASVIQFGWRFFRRFRCVIVVRRRWLEAIEHRLSSLALDEVLQRYGVVHLDSRQSRSLGNIIIDQIKTSVTALEQVRLSDVHWQLVPDSRSSCTEGSVAEVA